MMVMMVNDDDVYEYGLASGAHSRYSGRLVETFVHKLYDLPVLPDCDVRAPRPGARGTHWTCVRRGRGRGALPQYRGTAQQLGRLPSTAKQLEGIPGFWANTAHFATFVPGFWAK